MDTQSLINGLRMEAEGIIKDDIPLNALPNEIQNIVLSKAKTDGYSVEYLMGSVLVAASSAIGNAVNIRIHGDWISNPALYMILVGRPGFGKSTPIDFAFRPLRKHDAKAVKKFKVEYEEYNALLEKSKKKKDDNQENIPKPVLKRMIVSDTTPEALLRVHSDNQRGIVICVDEIMGMFNTVNRYNQGQLIEQLLTAFSGKPLDVIRCNMPYPLHIEHPFINLIGSIQTTRIKKMVKKGFLENGFMDRILFVYPTSQKITFWNKDDESTKEVTKKYDDMWDKLINRILDLPFSYDDETDFIDHNIIGFSSEAADYFTDWRNTLIAKINEIEDDNNIKTRELKTPMIVARIALVLQVLKWASGEGNMECVDLDSVKSALALSTYFERCYSDAEEFMDVPVEEVLHQNLLDSLDTSFTTKQIKDEGRKGKLSERTVMTVLKELRENGIVRHDKRGNYTKLL